MVVSFGADGRVDGVTRRFFNIGDVSLPIGRFGAAKISRRSGDGAPRLIGSFGAVRIFCRGGDGV